MNTLKKYWYNQYNFELQDNNLNINDFNKLINDLLFEFGQLAITKHDKLGYIIGGFNVVNYNIYNEPLKIQINMRYKNIQVDYKDCVILKNDALASIPKKLINKYKQKLINFDFSIQRNKDNLDLGAIFETDKKTKATLISAIKQAKQGAYIVTTGKLGIGQSAFISNNVSYNIDKFQNQKDLIFKEFLQNIGIDNVNTKKERLLTSEIESNNNITSLIYNDMLNQRVKFVNELKSRFNIDVKLIVNNEYYSNSESEEL